MPKCGRRAQRASAGVSLFERPRASAHVRAQSPPRQLLLFLSFSNPVRLMPQRTQRVPKVSKSKPTIPKDPYPPHGRSEERSLRHRNTYCRYPVAGAVFCRERAEHVEHTLWERAGDVYLTTRQRSRGADAVGGASVCVSLLTTPSSLPRAHERKVSVRAPTDSRRKVGRCRAIVRMGKWMELGQKMVDTAYDIHCI